jgi:hypothetical protein
MTNFEGYSRVTKRMNRLFGIEHPLSLSAPTVMASNNKLYDMSIRDVYKAFAYDFELSEE